MWDYLIVSKEARLPRVQVTGKKAGAGGAQETKGLFAYDGHAWRRLSEGEKLALLSGFLGGEALEQGLRFPFAPNVYKARLEDFYHYQDRLEIPLDRALFLINEHILQGVR
jgi:hypothetical protein